MPYVKPAEGLVIPDPDRHDMLPPAGREVPANDFWLRRLRDNDVVLAARPLDDVLAEPPAEPTHEGA